MRSDAGAVTGALCWVPVQVLYVSGDDLDTITKLEKGSRAGSAAAVACFSCQGGCRRKRLLDYFAERRWVPLHVCPTHFTRGAPGLHPPDAKVYPFTRERGSLPSGCGWGGLGQIMRQPLAARC